MTAGPDEAARGDVLLRRLQDGDLTAFQAYRTDEAVGRFQGWSAQSDQQASAFIAEMAEAVLFPPGSWVQLAIACSKTNDLIGDVGVCLADDGASAELGFTISPRFQRQGLGTEVLQAAVDLVFANTPAIQVSCIVDERNIPSIRLLERAKMKLVATNANVFRGEPCIERTYSMSKTDGP